MRRSDPQQRASLQAGVIKAQRTWGRQAAASHNPRRQSHHRCRLVLRSSLRHGKGKPCVIGAARWGPPAALRVRVAQGSSRMGHPTNSASKFASTCFSCTAAGRTGWGRVGSRPWEAGMGCRPLAPQLCLSRDQGPRAGGCSKQAFAASQRHRSPLQTSRGRTAPGLRLGCTKPGPGAGPHAIVGPKFSQPREEGQQATSHPCPPHPPWPAPPGRPRGCRPPRPAPPTPCPGWRPPPPPPGRTPPGRASAARCRGVVCGWGVGLPRRAGGKGGGGGGPSSWGLGPVGGLLLRGAPACQESVHAGMQAFHLLFNSPHLLRCGALPSSPVSRRVGVAQDQAPGRRWKAAVPGALTPGSAAAASR